ncbi:toll/interleukin-1 receptor domain-containing protein [Mucilaginibacter sp. UC70_90]
MALLNKQDLKSRANDKFGLNAKSRSVVALLESTKNFSYTKEYDIFLSHSYLDADEVEILKEDLENTGFSVYVDWIEDAQLNRNNVSPYTATVIRNRMKNCKSLIYAFSENSVLSKWAPWELGYFDGFNGKVAVLPIFDKPQIGEDYSGVEFIGIYPYITKAITSFFVQENSQTWVGYSGWLSGAKPVKH